MTSLTSLFKLSKLQNGRGNFSNLQPGLCEIRENKLQNENSPEIQYTVLPCLNSAQTERVSIRTKRTDVPARRHEKPIKLFVGDKRFLNIATANFHEKL